MHLKRHAYLFRVYIENLYDLVNQIIEKYINIKIYFSRSISR